MKLFRKLFNRQSPEQKKKVQEQVAQIDAIVKEYCDKTNDARRETQRLSDNLCGNCGEKDPKNIVNKMAHVHGSGSVHGSFSLGYGSVHGSSTTDTKTVRHCNSCGNQWKEYNRKWQSEWDRKGEILNAIDGFIDDGDRYKFQKDIFEEYKHFYAETLWEIFQQEHVEYSCYNSVRDNLTLSKLREALPSVFD